MKFVNFDTILHQLHQKILDRFSWTRSWDFVVLTLWEPSFRFLELEIPTSG